MLLYGKILKNTVNEDYWVTQENLKQALLAQVKACYRERFSMKPVSEVNKHSEDVLADKFMMDLQIQARVVERMYYNKDAKELKEKLAERLRLKKQKVNQNKKSQKENIN